eukprot:gene8561-13908_t
MRWNWDGTRRVLRSAPARAKLRWPDWHQRRAATRASFVCGVLEKGAPPSLCGLVPPPEENHNQRLAKAQAELRIASQHPTRRVGDKGFRTWAPWVRKLVAMDAIYHECPDGPPDEQPDEAPAPLRGRPPSDEYALQRQGWYAFLRSQYANHNPACPQRQTLRPPRHPQQHPQHTSLTHMEPTPKPKRRHRKPATGSTAAEAAVAAAAGEAAAAAAAGSDAAASSSEHGDALACDDD